MVTYDNVFAISCIIAKQLVEQLELSKLSNLSINQLDVSSLPVIGYLITVTQGIKEFPFLSIISISPSLA